MKSHLVYPICQPDELIAGAIGRCADLNGIEHSAVVENIVPDKDITITDSALLPPLASAFGITLTRLIRQHTCTPFIGRLNAPRYAGHLIDIECKIAAGSITQPYGGYRVCATCNDEDMNWHGFSYWRRQHQLRGMTICLKHGHPLTYSRLRPLNASPDVAINNENTISQAGYHNPPSPFALKYMQIAATLLEATPTADRELVLARLRRRAKSLGMKISSNSISNEPTLGMFAMNSEQAHAIKCLSRQLSDNSRCNPWRSIDGTLTLVGRVSTAALCLAACILYDNIDDAIWALTAFEDNINDEISHEGHFEFANLLAAYIDSNGSYSQSAEQLGEPFQDVATALQCHALPDLPSDIEQTTCKALAAFGSGKSLKWACEKYGANLSKIEAILRDANQQYIYCAGLINSNLIKEKNRQATRVIY